MNEPTTTPCPVCTAAVPYNPRYGPQVCRDCVTHATDANDRAIELYNEDLSGGIMALYADRSRAELEWASPHRLVVYIRRRRFLAAEGRFGGIVVTPEDEPRE